MNKVTVRIWTPRALGNTGKAAWLLGVGHASLTVQVGIKKSYITWMAHGSPFGASTMNAYSHIDTFTKNEDKNGMDNFFDQSEPNYKIKLKTKQNDNDTGLDAQAIDDFWTARLANRPTYSFLSRKNNCTGCVADALRAGGMDQIVTMDKPTFVQDARGLLAWCLKAQTRLGPVDPKQ